MNKLPSIVLIFATFSASLLACGGASDADLPQGSEDALEGRAQEMSAGAWKRKTENGYRVAVVVAVPDRVRPGIAYELSFWKSTFAIPDFSKSLDRVAAKNAAGSYEDEIDPNCALTLRQHFHSIRVEQRGSCEDAFGLPPGERTDISGTYIAFEGIGD